jgi:hypothetical protein
MSHTGKPPAPVQTQNQTRPGPAKPPEVEELLAKVARLLQEGRPESAYSLIAKSKIHSPWALAAQGVCQLRLGDAGAAVDIFRPLVLGSGRVSLRGDAPAVFKANYVTALLASGNVAGGQDILAEIRQERHPAVPRLQAALKCWRASLTFWQKVNWFLGSPPDRPLVLNPPLGNLE